MIGPVSMDSIFINKLREIVLANLSNEKFGVEDLASEVGMSRINLYRKLKARKHQDISHFIREIRMQKAMELLQQNHYTAAEVSFRVGFGSPAYFNKCFSEFYGFPPGEVKRRIERGIMDTVYPLNDQPDKSLQRDKPDSYYSREARNSFQKYKKPLIIIGAVTLLIAVLVVSGYMMIRPLEMKKPHVAGTAEKSIAVVPFRNESPDPENDYVNSGVASEIYAHLQKIPGISLKSRTFTEQSWNREKDLQTFGRKLGVDYILEGSIRKIGDSIRITVQLSEMNTGNQVWADSYDGIYNDKVLAFQTKVAMEVASSLNLVLTGEEIKRIRHQSTRDILAWDLVSRGQYMMRMRLFSGQYNQSKYTDQALDFFNRAVEADPLYARVYYSMGMAYLMTFQYDSAMYYADKAIELDPDDYLGYKLKGTLYSMQGDLPHYPELAITYLTRALEMEPEDYFTIQALGTTYCLYTNKVKKGLSLLSQALILCNESMTSDKSINLWMQNSADLAGIYKNIGQTLMGMGVYDLAVKYFKKTLAMGIGMYGVRDYWKTLILLGEPEEAINLLDSLCNVKECEMQCYFESFRVYMLLGKYEEAEKSINKGFSDGGELSYEYFPDLALMYRKLGREEEALSTLGTLKPILNDTLTRMPSSGEFLIYAKFFSILNQKEKALKYLSEAVKIGMWANDADLLPVNPVFENLHEDPEFKALVKMAKEKIDIKRAHVREMQEKGELAL